MVEAVWNTMLELAPWLLLGAVIAGALHVLLPDEFTRRQFSGRGGVLKAVGLGAPLPLCSCGVIPVGLGLKKSGASNGAIVGFLISTPQTGVDSILVSASFLGWPFALLKVGAALVTGVAGGWIADAVKPSDGGLPIVDATAEQRTAPWHREMIDHCLMLIQSIWGWLAIGILVSAAITTYVPQDALTGLAAYGGFGAMLITLVISTPLYVCAVASVPIAAALVASGLPAGAALVFLMAGPATNVATLGAVYRTLGGMTLAIYLATVIAGSVLSGLLFGFVLDSSAVAEQTMHDHAPQWWAVASAIILAALLLWFAGQDVLRWRRRSASATTHASDAIEIAVEGMTCDGCTAKLERQLAADAAIESAVVTLHPGAARVQGDVSPERVRELIELAGFSAPARPVDVHSHGEGV